MTDNTKRDNTANTTTNVIIITLAVALIVFVVLFFNEKAKGGGGGDGLAIVTPLADDQPILKYAGGKITAKDLKGNVSSRVKQMSEEATEMYKTSAENALIERLLNEEVKKKGVANIPALLETVGSSTPVSDKDADEFIKTNKLEKGFKDPSTGKMRKVTREEVKAHLANKDKVTARRAYMDELMKNAKVEWLLKEPKTVVPALTAEEPVLGSRTAKVTVFEHSDFQCPYCSRGRDVVHEINKAYGDKVAIVFRHLPLDNIHPEAEPAAKASICAQQEGKFWEYHDKLFDNQKELGAANYLTWAKQLGLDETKFKECLTSSSTTAILNKSKGISDAVGASSTPTFFVATKDGAKKVAGAQSFAEFKKLIDEALR